MNGKEEEKHDASKDHLDKIIWFSIPTNRQKATENRRARKTRLGRITNGQLLIIWREQTAN